MSQENTITELLSKKEGETPPKSPGNPLKNQEIQKIISNASEKDMLFYEYEIVG